MGSEAIFPGTHWYFTGRETVLRKIVSWLDQTESGGSAYVVTGDPGSGKSAVLGYIVTASDGKERQQPALQNLLAQRSVGSQPRQGGVDVALHLKGKTLAEAQAALAACFNVGADDVLAALANRAKKTVLAFDALEEAAEPRRITDQLLRPLTGFSHLWLLIGSRWPEIANLGARIVPLDLDAPEFMGPDDVTNYILQLLLAKHETRSSPYRENPEAARLAAMAVAEAAKGNFLVARINARSLLERETPLQPHKDPLPSTPEAAFRDYLEHLAERSNLKYSKLRDLLRPLAYAQGLGLPLDIWERLAQDRDEVNEILELASAFVREYTEDGHPAGLRSRELR
jgi:hypothetical protein